MTHQYSEQQQEMISRMRQNSKEHHEKSCIQPQTKEEKANAQGANSEQRNQMMKKEYMRLYMQKRRTQLLEKRNTQNS